MGNDIKWKNKSGTSDRACSCGSWKQHWLNFSNRKWPESCSVIGCTNKPTLGAHVISNEVLGEQIVPMCDSCNKRTGEFNIKSDVKFVSANKSKTCEQ